MIWIHCGSDTEGPSTASIAARLLEHCDPRDILITSLDGATAPFNALRSGIKIEPLPADTPVKTRAFLDHWQPRSLIWNGGVLRPSLMRSVKRSKIPATFINARTAGLSAGGARWLPGATKSAVAAFHKILTADGATATRLIRGGVAPDRVMACGPILEDPVPLGHNQNKLAVMAEALGTRPVWLAADVIADEIDDLTTAHLAAGRKNHRLLLIMTLRDHDSGPHVAQRLRAAGVKVGLRSDGDDPDPEHQVYIADLDGELGLWYRLSPLTFVGGTLASGGASGGAVSPYDPILLGSAVIHGPRKAPHTARFARLAKVEACREIRSASELGVAVGMLISPDQTARIALAGWDEISHHAETINSLIDAALSDEVTP